MHSTVFIRVHLYTFGSIGLSTSVLRYFNKVIAMPFLISSLIKFEESASGMCLDDRCMILVSLTGCCKCFIFDPNALESGK